MLQQDVGSALNNPEVAVNVMGEPGNETNQLPAILTGWFGPDTGQPGTRHQVIFEPITEDFRLRPATETSPGDSAANLRP